MRVAIGTPAGRLEHDARRRRVEADVVVVARRRARASDRAASPVTMMSPFVAVTVTVPLLSNAKVVSMRDRSSDAKRARVRCAAAECAAEQSATSSASAREDRESVQSRRVSLACSRPRRRQHRRRAEKLNFGVERVVQRLHQEPARRIAAQREPALRDRRRR